MATPIWFVDLIKRVYPSRFFLSRLTRSIPPLGYVVEKIFFDGDKMFILPKDGKKSHTYKVKVGESIPLPEEVILPSQVVHHYIDQTNYLWKMNECLCRAAAGCKDYPIDLGCLFLGEAATGINPKLGHIISKEEAHRHIHYADEHGLVHIIGRNKLDTIWLGVYPGDRLMTICNCCPCCCLYNILPHITPTISKKFLRMPGVMVEVDASRCISCGQCVESKICFIHAISIQDGHAQIDESCLACGRCVEVCPSGAIQLAIQDQDTIRKTIKQIDFKIDVT